MPDIETIIRDLGIVEESFGDPNLNSGYTLFAGKTAGAARRFLQSLRAKEPIINGRNDFQCGSCKAGVEREDGYCRKCGIKIKWNNHIRDYF